MSIMNWSEIRLQIYQIFCKIHLDIAYRQRIRPSCEEFVIETEPEDCYDGKLQQVLEEAA